jgi:catechol 2,3-dioxygenase-like lactoylglutathione lyase family enzyme
MNKPIFNDVLQVGLVVKNVDEAVKEYADEYGIGPWTIYEFNPKTVKDMIIRDKREDYAMRLALCNIGKVQWELIEPKDDKSIYAEFLRTHGEGLHHVAFGVENYKEAMKFFHSKGHKIIQGGTWHGFTYTYLTTEKDLKCIAEIYDVPVGFEWPEPDAIYPLKGGK